ncbi:hypothetical protein QTP88_008226 [Uroleucon formosanum]
MGRARWKPTRLAKAGGGQQQQRWCHFHPRRPHRSNSQIQIRDVNYTKRNVFNVRRKTMPKLPKSSFDVHNFLNDTPWYDK